MSDLSKRQVSIIKGIVEGLSNIDIAKRLKISSFVVANEIVRIHEVLSLKHTNRVSIAVWALRKGICK